MPWLTPSQRHKKFRGARDTTLEPQGVRGTTQVVEGVRGTTQVVEGVRAIIQAVRVAKATIQVEVEDKDIILVGNRIYPWNPVNLDSPVCTL